MNIFKTILGVFSYLPLLFGSICYAHNGVDAQSIMITAQVETTLTVSLIDNKALADTNGAMSYHILKLDNLYIITSEI